MKIVTNKKLEQKRMTVQDVPVGVPYQLLYDSTNWFVKLRAGNAWGTQVLPPDGYVATINLGKMSVGHVAPSFEVQTLAKDSELRITI